MIHVNWINYYFYQKIHKMEKITRVQAKKEFNKLVEQQMKDNQISKNEALFRIGKYLKSQKDKPAKPNNGT